MDFIHTGKKRVFLLITVFLGFILLFKAISQKSSCMNPFQVTDYSKKRNETVQVCKDKINRGITNIATKKDYPDLFQFILNKKPIPTKQYIRVYEEQGKEYVAVTSVIDYTSWFSSAIGIYRKDKNEYQLVFKKSFSENPGRYVNIRFATSDYADYHRGIIITGDVGFLGCYACRINWTDYYNWNSKQQTYVLTNNKHLDEFMNMLEEYQKIDNESCGNEDPSMTGISISVLYPSRKDKRGFCFDNAKMPFIEPAQAATFLKAKKAIEKIIQGENISINQIGNVSF